MAMPTVYLAGPAVFHPAAKALLEYLTEICARHGLQAVVPADEPRPAEGQSPAVRARAIRDGNVARLRACDMVVACLSPFRGPSADPGTAWEMGFAEALGKPVVAWSEEPRPYLDRVPHDRDEDGRVFCRQHGMLVEDFGLGDNLMLAATPLAVQPDFESAVRLARQLWDAASTERSPGAGLN